MRWLQEGIAALVVRTPLRCVNFWCELSEVLGDFFVLQLRHAIPFEFNRTTARIWTIHRVLGTNIIGGGTLETPNSANILSPLRTVGLITKTSTKSRQI